MRSAAIIGLTCTMLLAAATPAVACRCAEPKNVEEALEKADVVFRGMPIVIKRTFPDDIPSPSRWDFVEEVTFVVKKAWKGTQVGARLNFKTGPSPFMGCGMSVLNDPEGISLIPTRGDRMEFGDDWIVFASGSEPYELGVCSGSVPIVNILKLGDRTEEAAPEEAELDRIVREKEGWEVTRLYFAYGRNMHPEIMAKRCPAAGFVGAAVLPDHRLLINVRGVSTVVPEAGSEVHGVLWRLTSACEAALDEIEGVARGSYRRDEVRPVMNSGITEPALIYIASNADPSLPRDGYLESLEEAALHHGFPEAYRLFLAGLRIP